MFFSIIALFLGMFLIILIEWPTIVDRWEADRSRTITFLATSWGFATCVYCGIWYGFMWLPPEESKAAFDIWFAIMAAVSLTLHGAAFGLVGRVIGQYRPEEEDERERPTGAR